MAHDVDLINRLRKAGLVVTEIAGWQTRGDDLAARGSVHHHTAGPRSGVEPSLGIVINGRPDLRGPLCNVHGPREESLRVNLVAAGKANHAGLGGWKGLSGNSSVWGLEEEHYGYPDEKISELRIDRMSRVHAAFLFGHADSSMACQHYEWAPTRKIDFVKGLIDPNDFRQRVQRHLDAMAGVAPTPPVPQPPAPPVQENDMQEFINPDGRPEFVTITNGRVMNKWFDAQGNESAWVPLANDIGVMIGVDAYVKDQVPVVYAEGAYGTIYVTLRPPNAGWTNWAKLQDWLHFAGVK